ncbi:hypothetical protein [uncultured Formosa sp.]|uniref:hypothetical protein n=1 Tax=uncultured Formosa sp. TaxID=255435 RepID=UPI002639EBA1|nr:hypothetical protein [uncultured Formosa sp.]
MERLLTSLEIESINSEYRTNPIYRYYIGRKMYREAYPITEILSVSDKTNLIMVKGNSDTGYDHIRERHNFFTTEVYTVKEKSGHHRFQHPNKFPPNIAPIDFIRIADSIYHPQNEIIENEHSGAQFFDLYRASIIFPGYDKPESVNLLIYKNTKIIHTLYPKRDAFERKIKKIKGFLFHRDKVEIEFSGNNKYLQIRIPYINVNRKLWYAIFIDKDFNTNIEYWSILVFLGHHISKYKIDYVQQSLVKSNLYRATYQYADLRVAESFIKDFDEKLKKGTVTLPNKKK